ncbi:MAG: ATP-binding protein [Endomicrobium sp.]|nr:ATP-binding protein [Endomicrobium sp.]
MLPFNKDYFLGEIFEVNPEGVSVKFASAQILNDFHYNAIGGNVGDFIVIEGKNYGFLARITEINLQNGNASGKAELLLTFKISEPGNAQKTVFIYPAINEKVYCCSNEHVQAYVESFGKNGKENESFADLGVLVSNEVKCRVSLNTLFKRHCAVVGTTGGGKSWTVSKLLEEVTSKTKTKVILFDATGEYNTIKSKTCVLGQDAYFPYQKLTLQDLFILLRPSAQSQRSTLLEAVRSLKIVRLAGKIGTYKKAYMQRKEYNSLYEAHVKEIEDNTCNFDINFLVPQLKEECVSYFPEGWGAADVKMYDRQASLVNTVVNMINTNVFNDLFGFKNVNPQSVSIINAIESFLADAQNQILRINLENVSSLFYAKEIIANALGSYLLEKARKREFVKNPVILTIDEAHQFLNKNASYGIGEEGETESFPLNAFDLIAKECRKHGVFLCIATQMPRDIPAGTLSQIGTFIVHRLINDKDKQVIENAVSSAGKNTLAFLPSLGQGEALLIGVDFQMPLLIKINKPENPPQSETPNLNQ